MTFPVFPDHLGPSAPHIRGGPGQQLFELPLPTRVSDGELTLGKALQEAAAGLAGGAHVGVDALEERIGDGDHYLGHGMSIYGVAGG